MAPEYKQEIETIRCELPGHYYEQGLIKVHCRSAMAYHGVFMDCVDLSLILPAPTSAPIP